MSWDGIQIQTGNATQRSLRRNTWHWPHLVSCGSEANFLAQHTAEVTKRWWRESQKCIGTPALHSTTLFKCTRAHTWADYVFLNFSYHLCYMCMYILAELEVPLSWSNSKKLKCNPQVWTWKSNSDDWTEHPRSVFSYFGLSSIGTLEARCWRRKQSEIKRHVESCKQEIRFGLRSHFRLRLMRNELEFSAWHWGEFNKIEKLSWEDLPDAEGQL